MRFVVRGVVFILLLASLTLVQSTITTATSTTSTATDSQQESSLLLLPLFGHGLLGNDEHHFLLNYTNFNHGSFGAVSPFRLELSNGLTGPTRTTTRCVDATLL
jgi:hypothetical protein